MAARARLVVLGTSRFATEIADIASECPQFEVTTFVENYDRARAGTELDGLPVVWIDDAAELARTHVAVCGLGTTKRGLFTDAAAAIGFRFATVVHPEARVSRRSVLGEGTIVARRAQVSARAQVGSHVLLSNGALVGFGSELDDFASLMVGANVGDGCRVGARAYVGMSAVVVDGAAVGAGSVVGAGAVVQRDVPDASLALGVPAEVVKHAVEAP